MPTDATGTPTSLGIPTFNVDVDEPSGLGFNEAMTLIDSLLVSRSGVASAFGRTGAVVANSGDYSVGLITGAAPLASPALTGAPTAPTPLTADNTTKIATTAWVRLQNYLTANAVTTVFGRSGAVVAATGDYTAAQVTNAADTSSSSIQVFNAPIESPNVLYPIAGNGGSNTFTPIVDQSGHVEATVVGVSGTVVTVNNPGHFPASGVMSHFSITLTCSSISSVSGITWGNAYKFGTHTSNVALGNNQSYTWFFIMDGSSSKVVCVGDSGTY